MQKVNAALQESEGTGASDRSFGVFVDSFGNEVALVSGLRDRLAPNWQGMIKPPDDTTAPPSIRSVRQRLAVCRSSVERIAPFLGAFSRTVIGQDVLEIGAHDGATAYALALSGAERVVATDIAAYYITQSPGGRVSEEAISTKNQALNRARAVYADAAETVAHRVRFLEDDICSSSLPSESVDVVVSWEVLEHLLRPGAAFREMCRVLRPGGVGFHEYNPFFSISGGHSLCTLDYLWGHARLSRGDFERYLDEERPAEKDVALSFYENNLNRMSLAQLLGHIEEAGLGLLSVIPWNSQQDLGLLTAETLDQCQRVFPDVGVSDLVSRSVWLLVEKRGEGR